MEMNQLNNSWNPEDLHLANRYKKELSDPDSILNQFLAEMVIYQDKLVDKVAKSRKDGDSLVKLSGSLQAVRYLIGRPDQIVATAEAFREGEEVSEQNKKIVEGQENV